MLPNFFLVGAHKSGTTALYAYLGQHPDVFLSPRKEPRYFVPEFWPERLDPRWMRRDEVAREIVTRWEDYVELFRGARPGQAVGEASVGYLWSPTAARSIHERLPEARILMILRNPVERALSHYHGVSPALRRESFALAIRRSATEAPTQLVHPFQPFLDLGAYAGQVARYQEQFPSHQVRILLYDDFVAGRESFVRGVFEFLGVSRDVPLDLTRRYNEARLPRFPALEVALGRASRRVVPLVPKPVRRLLAPLRWRRQSTPRMDADDARFLVGYYTADVRRVEALIGRDLSAWLR